VESQGAGKLENKGGVRSFIGYARLQKIKATGSGQRFEKRMSRLLALLNASPLRAAGRTGIG